MTRPSVAAGVLVRPPDDADVPAVAELIAQLGYPPTLEQMRERLDALDASPSDHVLIAVVDGRVVGFASLHVARLPQMEQPRAELTALVTDAAVRRRGVARALLAAIEALARQDGCSLFFLRTNKAREDSHALYRASGFEESHLTFNKEL